MSRPIRAVLYGVGRTNSNTGRLLLDYGVHLVGAIARSPEREGVDLGEHIGLGRRLGVPIELDADAVLSRTAPDIAVIATNALMADHEEHVVACVRNGVNVMTIAEELMYPWYSAPAAAARVDALAKRHGVTVVSGGHTDIFWVGLPLQLTAACSRIDSVVGEAVIPLRRVTPTMFDDLGLGLTPEEFADRVGTDRAAERGPSIGRTTCEAIATGLGLVVTATRDVYVPRLAAEPRTVTLTDGSVREIPVGHAIGLAEEAQLLTDAGVEFRFTGVLEPDGTSGERWVVSGDPTLRMSTSTDHDGVPPTSVQTVVRIPDVLDAPAGLVSIIDLPPLRARRPPLHAHVRTVLP